MATLVYKCPHCGAAHDVDESLMGDQIDCRECGRPFEVSVPVARPVEQAEGASASYQVGAGEGDLEDEIITVHPAVFRQSPLLFLGLVLLAIAGLAGVLLGTVLQGMLAGWLPGAVLWIGGAILLIGAVGYLAIWSIQARFTRLTITDRRTTLRYGLISRETSEVGHEDVRNIRINQGIMERLLGVGTLSISSAGQDTLEIVFKGAPDPEKLAAVIRDMQR